MNIYVFRGLRQDFRSFAASLSSRPVPLTLEEMADQLGAQEFAHAAEFPQVAGSPSVAHVARRGSGRGGRRGSQQWRGGSSRGGSGYSQPSSQQWRGGSGSPQFGQQRGRGQ